MIKEAISWQLERLAYIAPVHSSYTSSPIRDWLQAHPRIQQAFIPVGAAWLYLIEGWWRPRQAKPWVCGRPPKPHRVLRHRFVYCL
jgi:hypothetical protein